MSLTPSKHARRSRVKRVPTAPPKSPFYLTISGCAELREQASRISIRSGSEAVAAFRRKLAVKLLEDCLGPLDVGRKGFLVPSIGDVYEVCEEIAARLEPTDALIIDFKARLDAARAAATAEAD